MAPIEIFAAFIGCTTIALMALPFVLMGREIDSPWAFAGGLLVCVLIGIGGALGAIACEGMSQETLDIMAMIIGGATLLVLGIGIWSLGTRL